jgi:hypothetical protein
MDTYAVSTAFSGILPAVLCLHSLSQVVHQQTIQPARIQTMSLRINDTAPDLTPETTYETIAFHEWIGDGWAILFWHPKEFTPVRITELAYMARLQPHFAKRNCKILALSARVTNREQGDAN